MKYTNYLFVMIAAVGTLLSCQNDEKLLGEVTNKDVKFTATIESYDQGTRTALNSNGNVVWKKGDQVSIFAGSTANELYQVLDASEGKTSATIDKVNGSSFVGGSEISANVAYYPYDNSTEMEQIGSSYSITANIPAVQNYSENSFGNGAFPMVAVTDGTSDKALKFYNLMGGLKLQLLGTCKVKTITLTGNAGEILYGPATITVQSGSAPVAQLTGTTQKTVTLNCSGVQLNTSNATTFIIAVPAGTLSSGFKVVITDTDGKVMEKSATASNTIVRSKLTAMPAFTVETTGTPNVNGHEYVDLGLPSGVLWATMNVGATASTEYGDYFAWGEVTPKPNYNWSTYKYCKYYSGDALTKYCDVSNRGYNNYTDRKTILDAIDDAATVNWGGSWRMPTLTEIDELLNIINCTCTFTQINEVYGYKITSKKSGYEGNFIFLPAAGYKRDSNLFKDGSYGVYWSSSLRPVDPYDAYVLDFYSTNTPTISYGRFFGRTIRPVCSNNSNIGITGVLLDKNSISLSVGMSETLTATISKNDRQLKAINTQVEWLSSNPSVAIVDNEGNVTALSEGTTTISVRTVFGGFTASCTVTVLAASISQKFVDLGLSVKWATMNVGATVPWEYGDYFAWGATEPLYEPGYAQENPLSHWKDGKSDGYTYYNTTFQTVNTTVYYSTRWTKYVGSATSSYKDASITDANAVKTVLDSSDDAASANWGSAWRMPTITEVNELKNTYNCTWTWYSSGNEEFNGIAGYKVTSKKGGYEGNYIFLPAAGSRSNTELKLVGSWGYYWSSTLLSTYPCCANSLSFSSSSVDTSVFGSGRCFGHSVRPVCK